MMVSPAFYTTPALGVGRDDADGCRRDGAATPCRGRGNSGRPLTVPPFPVVTVNKPTERPRTRARSMTLSSPDA